jgi:hypothetical protein
MEETVPETEKKTWWIKNNKSKRRERGKWEGGREGEKEGGEEGGLLIHAKTFCEAPLMFPARNLREERYILMLVEKQR